MKEKRDKKVKINLFISLIMEIIEVKLLPK